MDKAIGHWNQLEGHRVNVALADGSRIDDAALVSAGRGRTATIWLFTGGVDLFVPTTEVRDVWEDSHARTVAA